MRGNYIVETSVSGCIGLNGVKAIRGDGNKTIELSYRSRRSVGMQDARARRINDSFDI
jgi:hypothetical protein